VDTVKVHIVGGGPAGLYLAILLRQLDHQVAVWERNPKNNTFGWGVVFSDQTIASLEAPDPVTHRLLTQRLRTWENVDIIHRGQLTSVAGNRFSGIARIDLLQVLQERCQQVGVQVEYGVEVQHIPAGADLIVGADGVASRLRQRYRKRFGTQLGLGRNRYIWYGTRAPFGGLTLTFRLEGDDLFMAHSYKYNQDLSTFIVEVDEATWQRLRYQGEERARRRLEKVFAPELQGQPLLSNRSKWIRFVNVVNQHWFSGNMVLLGDALHTAHFSIGSGTKLAMEDSLALWQSFRSHPRVEQALPAFETARRPGLDRFLEAAVTSQRWFENARSRMELEVLPFCYQVMTRSSRVDDTSLQRRDPAFVAAYQNWLREAGPLRP
jgi:anthraniloyl-CoA monooxygenase